VSENEEMDRLIERVKPSGMEQSVTLDGATAAFKMAARMLKMMGGVRRIITAVSDLELMPEYSVIAIGSTVSVPGFAVFQRGSFRSDRERGLWFTTDCEGGATSVEVFSLLIATELPMMVTVLWEPEP
jgi:hypothetical protein